MMVCSKCGAQISEEFRFCPFCGCNMQTGRPARSVVMDGPNAGYMFLGVFVPIAGLILWVINKDTKPLAAKFAGTGALIGAALPVVSMILFYIYYLFFMGIIYSLG